MKQTQWTVAVLLLAAMVFIVTFAMNYLGGNSAPKADPGEKQPAKELIFDYKLFPPDGISAIEREDKERGHQDYWFHNPNDRMVKLGLNRKTCKCTAVEGYVLPLEANQTMLRSASALCGVAGSGAIPTLAFQSLAMAELQKEATKRELLRESEFLEVPPGGTGWVRLIYTGEKAGKTSLGSEMWMDSLDSGKVARLELRLLFYEPLRAKAALSFGSIREEELVKGVTRYIYYYSFTRPSLKVNIKYSPLKGNRSSDPFQIGDPEPVEGVALRQFDTDVNTPGHELQDPVGGRTLCAYRIPVTLRAQSADGKTPFDLGPFRRVISLSLPDSSEDPRLVTVTGYIRGGIEVGSDDEGGSDVHLRVFSKRFGRKVPITLQTDLQDVNLEFDRSRTPEFLNATIEPDPTPAAGRRFWKVVVEALPNKASGPFPRNDPAYQDSAIYLKMLRPGKPPRSVRIGVSGTASEG